MNSLLHIIIIIIIYSFIFTALMFLYIFTDYILFIIRNK